MCEQLRTKAAKHMTGSFTGLPAGSVRGAEWRMPSDPILHTLSNLMAKSFCLHATRLGSANRQALERLIPKFLQILLHAEPSALLFYQEKRG